MRQGERAARQGSPARADLYRRLRDAILGADYKPGEPLSENALAQRFGVSRTPVRVALARLQDEGWIHIYPKRGAIVQGIDERTVAELADARFVLETTAVERASEPMRQRLAEKLDGLITQHRAAFAEGDVARFIELTLEFHRGFVEAGDNRVMLEMYALLSDRHRFTLFMNSRHLLERSDELIAEHEALVKHLRSGDSAAFAATLQSHIAENAGPASPR